MDETSTNYWFHDKCAKAFWDQRQAIPYQELVRDTARKLDPRPGERWLDLGCGGGQLTALLWQLSGGKLAAITSIDCAGINAKAIAKLRTQLNPVPPEGVIRFEPMNLSDGLQEIPDASIDGVVSGLALSYAESIDPTTGRYTDAAFRNIFAEIHRVLKPNGRLVFSINVPEPRFWSVVWKSVGKTFPLRRMGKLLLNVYRMQRYGDWLKQEARKGRFHYLPIQKLEEILHQAGFRSIHYVMSYANQAYVIRAGKQAVANSAA